MPVFNESITEKQVLALQAYVLEKAWGAYDAQSGNDAHH
jgi:hypothetical protein